MKLLPPSTSKITAMSLIEILVVMAIIATLSILVMANAGNWKAGSDKVGCTGNLRQIFLYLNNYAQENNGTFPPGVEAPPPGNNTNPKSWWLVLQTFINTTSQDPAVGKKTIFLCPAALETYPNRKASRTYAMNVPDSNWSIPCRPQANTKPGQTLFIIDSCNGPANSGDGFHYFRANSFASSADPRHSGKINGLYLDGHVGQLSMNDPDAITQIQNLGR